MPISWPAVMQFENVAELLLLSDENAWQREAMDLSMSASDRIIDSQGRIFKLFRLNGKDITLIESGEKISLFDFLGLVKAHAAEQGSCCVAKLYAPSFQDAFEMLGSLDQ